VSGDDGFINHAKIGFTCSVIATLKYWLESHFSEDFGKNELLLGKLQDFVDRIVVVDWETLGQDILSTLEKQV
jgi:hypothetical protein